MPTVVSMQLGGNWNCPLISWGSYAAAMMGGRPAAGEKHFKLFVKSKQNESAQGSERVVEKEY
jgi:hypothetical protein